MKAVSWKSTGVAVAILIAIAAIVGFTGTYPVMSVNGKAVSASRFEANFAAAELYYGNVSDMFGEAGSSLPEFSERETRAAVLTQLVEAALVHEGVYREAGDSAEELIRERAEKYSESGELKDAAKDLYGMSYEDFTREVIRPQAERDILAGRLFLKGGNIEDWLAEAKKSAEVRIFAGNFTWTGEKVEAKN